MTLPPKMTMMCRAWPILTLALVACAPSAQRFGSQFAPVPAGDARSFAMAQDGPASEAVRKALVEAGYQDRQDGAAFRVEVGFAVRPRQMALLAEQGAAPAQVLSPAGQGALSFCRRQAYVLTVALVERPSGRIRSRSGATISRCKGEPAAVLPILAQAALSTAS